jgi:hypothetical protein
MREQIEQIRVLLEELEQSTSGEATAFKESFELFELPELVASVVDYLQPLLTPYEAAMYWQRRCACQSEHPQTLQGGGLVGIGPIQVREPRQDTRYLVRS